MTFSIRIRGTTRRLALAAGVLAACVTWPAALAAQNPAATRVATGEPLPLQLSDAIRLATGSSEQIGLARASILRARGQQYQARSALLPQLGTTFNYQKQLQNQFQAISERFGGGDTGGGAGGDSSLANNPLTRIFASPYTLTFGLSASQSIFTGGRSTALVRAANAGRELAEIGVTSAQAQVALDVTQAYFDALLADQLVTIAESSLVQTERAFRQVQLTRNVGSASEFELVRARVTRDNQRPAWLQSRTNRDLAYLRLRQLLDLPLDRPLVLTDRPADGTAATAAPAPAAITTINVTAAEALTIDPAVRATTDAAVAATDTSAARRAPVRQALRGVEIAKQQLRATRAQRWPSIGISTNYQRLAYPSDGVPRNFNEFFPNWTAAVGVSFPFFTGGRVRGEEMAAQAVVAEAEAQLKLAQEGASLDARQAIAQLEEADAAWQASVGTEEQATRAYSIAEVRFREGISTQIELSETRVQLQQALANRARAARDLAVARARVQLLPNLPFPTGSGSSAGATGGSMTGGAAGSGTGAPSSAGGAQRAPQANSSTPMGNTP